MLKWAFGTEMGGGAVKMRVLRWNRCWWVWLFTSSGLLRHFQTGEGGSSKSKWLQGPSESDQLVSKVGITIFLCSTGCEDALLVSAVITSLPKIFFFLHRTLLRLTSENTAFSPYFKPHGNTIFGALQAFPAFSEQHICFQKPGTQWQKTEQTAEYDTSSKCCYIYSNLLCIVAWLRISFRSGVVNTECPRAKTWSRPWKRRVDKLRVARHWLK